MGVTCILTVHGIGFQEPPAISPPRPGYADALHAALRAELGGRLADDPNRPDGPIYVESSYHGSPKDGLARLDGPLRKEGASADIVHVALVYAELELPVGSRVGAALDTGARALLSLEGYAHPLSLAELMAADVAAELHHGPAEQDAPGLHPRRDAHDDTPRGHERLRRLAARATPDRVVALRQRASLLAALEEDVASYVCRNDLRESVRGFVAVAVDRLAARHDVDAIVFNAHSQGTVVAFDVLAAEPRPTVRALLTAGSPLRKYVQLFAWGDSARCVGPLVLDGCRWLNVLDRRDPVADPLRGDRHWRVGDAFPANSDPTLFRVRSADVNIDEAGQDCPVEDATVDNLAHSTGNLRAHNYWDNTVQFIPMLANLVTAVAGP